MWTTLTYYNHSGAFAEEFRLNPLWEIGGFAVTAGLAYALKMYRDRSVASAVLMPGGSQLRLGFHTLLGGTRFETVDVRDISFNSRSAVEKATTYTFQLPGRKFFFAMDKSGEMDQEAMRYLFGPTWTPPPLSPLAQAEAERAAAKARK
jgi:hypothetical protein